ncbi:cytidylyltransferase domain-containing protein [Candidatus Galacturonibacter soehngenii]|uniref:CMP-N-acetylneuraminic acid synthetase n=1 Tax=Candidatus Galacturonatibacter soehngenii TaxID=2307010 RepID=A0A7V7UC09_9FIRM|nr:CMP-N-acetylneuraminic acid synthetase [Candidatus Galacturonibacter soehngenii]KAB1438648.1 CMP-N-acetylneuraminic acid synthetase [Candidatus Galacturonibacter soehngenii]
MEIYSLLTGRGKNTLRDKNILDILGKPVLYYPATAVANSKYVKKNYCSSDDSNILKEAKKIGYIPIVRPHELALPTAQHIDSIYHALDIMKSQGEIPDILITVLANNVTIKTEWVDECIEIMLDDMSVSAVVPIYQDNDHHPVRAKKIGSDGNLVMYDSGQIEGEISTNRQDLPECFFLAHNFWVLNVKTLLRKEKGEPPWDFMGKNVKPYRIDESIDIHDLTDLELARVWVSKNRKDVLVK